MKIPRSKNKDYTNDAVSDRHKFIAEKTGVTCKHIHQYAFDPAISSGNIENFIGVAQVPLGLAGPLLVNGEFARGNFYVPLATTEGSLVASYSRGMRLCSSAGGVQTSILADSMQRAPIFVFRDARFSRNFEGWVQNQFAEIKKAAESTSRIAKLLHIQHFTTGKLHWLRFNYSTGDAAGQNMVTRATREACQWILQQEPPGLEYHSLAANMDTDKKHSQLNNLHSRGKRAVAEITIPAEMIGSQLRTNARTLHYQRQLSNVGSQLSGSVNNGSHSANGLTALFIATGQDVANIAESSAAIIFSEIRTNGDYYFSVTIPSLIVATYGGGTALPTQRECLDILGCFGPGNVNKLAEIAVATVLCGELSLSAAVVSDEWVSSHEKYGRNR